jgi:hypothetical protein
MVDPFTCPICKHAVHISPYLQGIFKGDIYALWAACLTTHQRHEHTNYYDRSWRSGSYQKKNPEYENHDQFKILVNNRCKRNLIRAAKKNFPWPTAKKLIQGFIKLQNNDEKTLHLIDKILHLHHFVKQERLDKYEIN